MNIIREEEGIELIAKQAILRNLVPVFGAGFTVGCLAQNGSVPDCNGAMEYMNNEIKRIRPEMTDRIIETVVSRSPTRFCGIADLYFKCVPSEARARYFRDNFTNVILPPELKEFLTEVNWPYAYTINFDDAIENNTSFIPFLPYRKFNPPQSSLRRLYKLHGDAKWECQYDGTDQQNIVFSFKQYLQAITDEKNGSMRTGFSADLASKHVIFIGCSLSYEPDIEYIFEKIKDEVEPNSKRIILRDREPSFEESIILEGYGISDAIIVSSYSNFYVEFLEKYRQLKSEMRDNVYSFFNPKVIPINNKKKSLEILANGDIFDENNNHFKRGCFQVIRNICTDINNRLANTRCIIIKGRRISGKTAIMCDICRSNQHRDCYYFPSTTVPDEDVIQQLFNDTQDSIFLFDSNSISSSVYYFIIDSEETIINHNHSIVIAVNSSDNYLSTIFRKVKPYVIEIPLAFYGAELTQNRTAADRYGITRRKESITNVDYLYQLKEDKVIELPKSIIGIDTFELHDIVILILLAALEKTYCSDLIALGIPNWETERFIHTVNQTYPIVESAQCTPEEATKHSTIKIVHNSKFAVLDLLRQLDNKSIVDGIQYIVSRCKNDFDRKRLYIDVMLFDTLNQLFDSRQQSDVLINQIYQSLEPILCDDFHFWLQRSKFLYRSYTDEKHLKIAYQYAKKVHNDSRSAIKTKSALNLALITCALAEKEKNSYNRIELYSEAIEYAYEAVFSEYYSYNPRYLYDALALGLKKQSKSVKRIVKGCEYLREKLDEDNSYKHKCSDIINRFRELEEEYQKK